MTTMTRTIISLDDDMKHWLEQHSKHAGVSMAELIRSALRLLQAQEQKTFEDLLAKTSGTWTQGDGLDYQTAIRAEWDREK